MLEGFPCLPAIRFLSRPPRAGWAAWAAPSSRHCGGATCRSALVRREDERAAALRTTGAEVVVGDLTRPGDVLRALAGCQRMYFGMSVSAPYLEATVATAAAARIAATWRCSSTCPR